MYHIRNLNLWKARRNRNIFENKVHKRMSHREGRNLCTVITKVCLMRW